jgi:hypothetical protein
MAVCMGINCSPCSLLCTATAATCFHNNTEVTTDSGPKRIEDIQEGELVQGEHGFEPLGWKEYMPAELNRIDMVTAHFRNPDSALTVTQNHWMIVQGSPIAASNVAAGMVMARDASFSDQRVVAVTHSQASGRWALSTGSCTIYANGILTGSLCTNQSSNIWQYGLMLGLGMSDKEVHM